MSNINQILATMAKHDAQYRAATMAFVGPKPQNYCDVRVGDIIDFRDRYNGNRYTGEVLGFGDGLHVGSCQMRVQVYSFNGLRADVSNRPKGLDGINVTIDEFLAIIR